MDTIYQKKLKNNLWKFFVYYITNRRIYWPLLTVYFLTFPDNTLQQIGIFLAIGQIGGFILEIPSGYISDKIGHKKALIVSKLALLISTSFYLIGGNLFIFILGSVFFTAGLAFHSGTFTAFSHEVLYELNQSQQYSKVLGKIRSKTLIVSAVLLAILPFFVQINFKIPFFIAFVFDLVGLITVISFTSPQKTQFAIQEISNTNFKKVLKEGRQINFYPIAILTSLIMAIVIGSTAYRDVYQQFLGFSVIYLGILLALSRIIASWISNFSYAIYNKFSAKKYFLIVIIAYFLLITSLGYFQNKWYVAIAFIILVGSLWGTTSLFEHYKLDYLKNSNFKATQLSVGGLMQNLFIFVFNLLIAFLIGQYLYKFGFLIYGIIAFIVLLIIYVIFIKYEKIK